MKRSNRSASGRGISALLPIGLLIALYLFLRGKSSSVTGSSPQGTIQNLLTAAGYSDRVARWWTAVSDLETGTWTSKLFRDYNNLFGMKQPLTRFSYSRGASASPPGYATFDSQADSVRDLIAYMNQRNYPSDFNSIDDMVAFMKSKQYFEDPLYLQKVKTRL
jgi:hypothetical protein